MIYKGKDYYRKTFTGTNELPFWVTDDYCICNNEMDAILESIYQKELLLEKRKKK